jgi:hypothetical protein
MHAFSLTQAMKSTRLSSGVRAPRAGLVTLALMGMLLPTEAIEVTLDFDSVASGRAANSATSVGITFEPATFVALLDSDGIPRAGTEAWRVDPAAGPVTVENPERFGRGPAPSPGNAMEALFQPVLVQFDSPQLIRHFSVTLDNDPFGERGLGIGFYDGANRLIASLEVNQTIPGYRAVAAFDLAGVDHVVLPAGAFYDDLRVSAVPEPGVWALGILGLTCLGVRRWKSSQGV